MNDKRCPACDLLVGEDVSKCSCQFVFWDDTPDHVITFGRLLFSAALLCSAVVIGTKLSNPFWAGQAKISLMALCGIALSFNIMPNVRKHGGYALSLTFIVLAVTAYSLGAIWWETHPEETDIAPRIYDKESEISMAGLKIGQPLPDDVPKGVQIDTDDRGLIIAITGRSVEQGPFNLLKVGDNERRLTDNFPRSQYSGRIHRLNEDASLFVTLANKRVVGISLLEGGASPGGSGTLDGFMLGTSESVQRVLERERNTIPRIVYSKERPRVIVGLAGQTFEQEGKVVKIGQHINEVPPIYGGYGTPFTTVVYDANNTVKEVRLGKFDSSEFGPPLLSVKESKKLEAILLFQKCAESDEQNRPTVLAEEWGTPIGKLNISGPRAKTASHVFRKSEHNHSAGPNGERESDLKIGEKSHWRDKGCQFLQNGEYFDLYLDTKNRSLSSKEKAYIQDFGRAIVELRSQK